MNHLIIADIQDSHVSSATLSAIAAAKNIAGEIHLLVAHSSDDVAKKASAVEAVAKVIHVKDSLMDHMVAEDIAPIIVEHATNYTHIWAGAGTSGKNIMPRVAALLDIQQISDITAVIDATTFERPIYAGNAILTVKSHEKIQAITVRSTSFEPVAMQGNTASIDVVENVSSQGKSKFVRIEETKSERPELTTAGIVVSGGRGMAAKENFAMLESLASVLNAAVGASRAAVDAGYAPNDYQVGQTGKVVAPNLYLAIGISGAIQHLAGMKDSKIIVAINKDEDAPIFQVADYGIVGDLFDLVPKLEAKLKEVV